MAFELTDRDHIEFALTDINLDAQLMAARSLLRRNREADAQLTEDIRALEERARSASGPFADRLVDDHIDLLYASVFHDAANSMAAVGMVAPMMESTFVALFEAVGRQSWPLVGTKRRTRAGDHPAFWDARIYYPKSGEPKADLALGVDQLLDATGMASYMPVDFARVQKALTAYRNRMLHNGFEWPKKAREDFARLIETEGWPDSWFSRATSGGKPWAFYMTDELIELCFTTVETAWDGAGRFIAAQSALHGFVAEEGESTSPSVSAPA